MKERNIKEVDKREVRVKRPSINGLRDILTVDQALDPAFHYCWVNDSAVEKFKRSGYEHVESIAGEVGEATADRGSSPTTRVSRPMGNGVTGFLMRIPQEWHEEDMAEIAKDVNEREAAIRGSGKTSGMYGNISIERK